MNDIAGAMGAISDSLMAMTTEPATEAPQTRSRAYVDCETTGTDPSIHDLIEVAWVVDEDVMPESHVFAHTLRNADREALSVNGYFTRADFKARRQEPGPATFSREDLAAEDLLMRALSGATIVCQNPGFDIRFIERKFGYITCHYRPLDLASYAMGVLGLREPEGLARTHDRLDNAGRLPLASTGPKHTATSDVIALRDCVRALDEIRAERAGG